MKKLLAFAILHTAVLGGCVFIVKPEPRVRVVSEQTRSYNNLLNCVAHAKKAKDLTPEDRAFIVRGCQEIWIMELNK